jgi:acid phosphatase type 7
MNAAIHNRRLWLVVPAAAALLTVSVSGVQPADASTSTSTFTAVADSYVVQQKPTANFGTQKQLKLQGSPITRSYVRFNVQGLSGRVVSATLRLNSQTTASVGYDVRSVADNTWVETTITYQNAPPPSATITGSSGALTSGQFSSVNITPLVAGNGLISMALTTSSNGITLSSRGTGPTAPQLVVQTTTDVPPANTSPPTISGTPQAGQVLDCVDRFVVGDGADLVCVPVAAV